MMLWTAALEYNANNLELGKIWGGFFFAEKSVEIYMGSLGTLDALTKLPCALCGSQSCSLQVYRCEGNV